MPVKLQGQHIFPAPREVVWQALITPEILAATLPGCERLQQVAENQYEGLLNLKVGPVQGQFAGAVTLSELDPPSSYHLQLKGQGAPGFVEGAGKISLADGGETTVLTYEVDAQVGGRIAGVGQRLLDSSAKVITRQALEGLERQIAALPRPASSASAPSDATEPGAAQPAPSEPRAVGPVTPVAPPSQAEFAAQFAKGLAQELVPAKSRPWIWIALVAALAAAAFLLVRACGS